MNNKYTLKQARVGVDLTGKEIARKLGISDVTYRKYEKNPKKMPVKTLIEFCKITNVKWTDLDLGGENE